MALLLCLPLSAAEYFVSPNGNDTNDGLSPGSAFASVQRGVDRLEAGDTLTILPGEYFGSVRREGIGGAHAQTTIRAAIPSTVVLRGDIPLSGFRPHPEHAGLWVTDLPTGTEAHAVNELDTLSIIGGTPDFNEVTKTPGKYFFDAENGRLYLMTSDMRSPVGRPYTVSTTGSHGLFLADAENVVVEGLSITGFNRQGPAPRSDRSQYTTWGLVLADSRNCVVRNCDVYLNNCGIQVSSDREGNGNNRVENSTVWASAPRFEFGDVGGITLKSPRSDLVLNSEAFLNHCYGMNIRSDVDGYPDPTASGEPVFTEAHRRNVSRLVNNLSWGNDPLDYKIKTGGAYLHEIQSSIGPGRWQINPQRVSRSLIGGSRVNGSNSGTNLVLNPALSDESQFADPLNRDYRLQKDSAYRGTAPGGSDPGPMPWQPTVYFLAANGDDTADGLSVSASWRTLERALAGLKEGDTLYIGEGCYPVEQKALNLPANVTLAARGVGTVVLDGNLTVADCSGLDVRRIVFNGALTLADCTDVAFESCTFLGSDGKPALSAASSNGLRAEQCAFPSAGAPAIVLSQSTGAHLQGNLYATTSVPAVSTDTDAAIAYSDYNGYTAAAAVWSVAGNERSLQQVQQSGMERYSSVVEPDYDHAQFPPLLRNAADVAARGPQHRPLGPYRYNGFEANGDSEDQTLTVTNPQLHSVTDVTVDIEWLTSAYSGIQVTWGTEDEWLQGNVHSEPRRDSSRAGSFSLTNLTPDTVYHVAVRFDQPVQVVGGDDSISADGDTIEFIFRTAPKPAPARTYYVAKDGDDAAAGTSPETAWATITRGVSQLRPGDTLLVGGGVYNESVRIRSTGAAERPITIAAIPGERPVINGMKRSLDYAFLAENKSYLKIDGFYFREIALGSDQMPWNGRARSNRNNGAIVLFESHYVTVSRCFLDGRGTGSSPGLAHVRDCIDFTAENCVSIEGMGRLEIFWNSPGAVVRNCVFLRNSISHTEIHVRGNRFLEDSDRPVFRNCIFTDNLSKKMHQELFGGRCILIDNCFYLRPERTVMPPAGDGNIFANPEFAAVERLRRNPRYAESMSGAYVVDEIIRGTRDADTLDFEDFFATNPELVRRDIGLQREAFATAPR